ncbi:MAG: hypothetical protein ACSLEW_08030 [Nocardioides sp.]
MSDVSPETTGEKLVSQIEKALAEDGVWVSDTLRLSDSDEARIEQAVADFDGTAQVALINLDYDDLLTGGDFMRLAGIVHDDTGVDGLYVGLGPSYSDDGPNLEIGSFPSDYAVYQAARIAKLEHPDDIAGQVESALAAIEKGDLDSQWEAAQVAHPEELQQYFDYLSGTESAPESAASGTENVEVALPVLGLVAALVVAMVVGWVALRRGRAKAPASRVREFQLPRTVLTTVRAAEDRRVTAMATAELLALGEELSTSALSSTAPAALAGWQAALDHYEIARRIMERDHSPADVVGALVLARRAKSALNAARSLGRKPVSWAPKPGCYFNPLHSGTVTQVAWEGESGSVTVPACRPCASALRAGTEPDDILDFVHDSVPRHYFTLELGAWSATGYGSLDTDLLGRLVAG